MGAYLYKITGKPFTVMLNGQQVTASNAKFWMKPYYGAWEAATGGWTFCYDEFEKKYARVYKMQLGRLEKMTPASVWVMEDKRVIYWNQPRRYVWDDPNWEGAQYGKIIGNEVIPHKWQTNPLTNQCELVPL